MKWAIVAALVIGLVIARRAYLQWQAKIRNEVPQHPRVPAELLDGSHRTWVVFTTPYCASCGPVRDQLSADDPSARVVTVDATRQPHLAKAFSVRTAPTVLLADGEGAVEARLVGPEAVRAYFARTA